MCFCEWWWWINTRRGEQWLLNPTYHPFILRGCVLGCQCSHCLGQYVVPINQVGEQPPHKSRSTRVLVSTCLMVKIITTYHNLWDGRGFQNFEIDPNQILNPLFWGIPGSFTYSTVLGYANDDWHTPRDFLRSAEFFFCGFQGPIHPSHG